MINLKINNIDVQAEDGSTIHVVAHNAGFEIPTLCHKKGLPHYSSCMVCLVKNNKTNSFIPSCSAMVQDGMDIDVSGKEVLELRKKAVEMLLSEHRAECEAPCKIVCPAGYNIPLMNRFLAAGDFESAVGLSVSELKTREIECINCPGYCENACRRKKIDIPVSIRAMQIFIYKNIISNNIVSIDELEDNSGKTGEKKKRVAGKYNSRIGRLDEKEQLEWLKECIGNGERNRDIDSFEKAASESESCMHCDCRAADDCKLRNLAEEFALKDPRGKLVNAVIEKKINYDSGLIFENAKCIKCGLCVRLCEEKGEKPALCFINRGFVSIISEPLGEEFNNILKTMSNEVIEICPTGALSKLK